jgi:hypothetical protein
VRKNYYSPKRRAIMRKGEQINHTEVFDAHGSVGLPPVTGPGISLNQDVPVPAPVIVPGPVVNVPVPGPVVKVPGPTVYVPGLPGLSQK